MPNTGRVKSLKFESAYEGCVHCSPLKSIWFHSNLVVTIFVGPFVLSFSYFLIFIILTGIDGVYRRQILR